MSKLDRLPNDERVMQVGLFETDPNAVEAFAKRVAKFNQKRMSNIILDVEAHEKGDAQYPGGPHYKLRLTFPNHQVQEAFWLE
jgi:hypothetical protein